MGTVHRLDPGPDTDLRAAVEAFLDTVTNANTRRSYGIALGALTAECEPGAPLGVLEGEAGADRVAAWFANTWGTAAPATANARLGALKAATAWWRTQGWLTGDPLRRIRTRRVARERSRALDRASVEALLRREDIAIRERVLWRMLYETAARAQELLDLDVADLDTPRRRALVRRKRGAADAVFWQTGTARILPRLLKGRASGPVFLTDRRARVALPAGDLDPATGRARLSYRRAAEIFEETTRDLPGGPWELHQMRHSALTHAAEDGASAPMLMALSGHTSIASLAQYATPSDEAVARWQAERDPANRRRGR